MNLFNFLPFIFFLCSAASEVSFVHVGVWRKRGGGTRPVGKEILGKTPWSWRETGGDGGKLGSNTRPERWRGGRWKESTA